MQIEYEALVPEGESARENTDTETSSRHAEGILYAGKMYILRSFFCLACPADAQCPFRPAGKIPGQNCMEHSFAGSGMFGVELL